MLILSEIQIECIFGRHIRNYGRPISMKIGEKFENVNFMKFVEKIKKILAPFITSCFGLKNYYFLRTFFKICNLFFQKI